MIHLKPQIFHLELRHRRGTPPRLKTSGACFTPDPPQGHPRAQGCIFGWDPQKQRCQAEKAPAACRCRRPLSGAHTAAPHRPRAGLGSRPLPQGAARRARSRSRGRGFESRAGPLLRDRRRAFARRSSRGAAAGGPARARSQRTCAAARHMLTERGA